MKSFGSVALFSVGLIAVVLVGFWLSSEEPVEAEAGGPPPFMLPVTLATVELGDLEPRVHLTGSVTSARFARLGFLTGGRISSLDVREGDTVEENTVLGQLWDLDEQAELARAVANRELAQRELEKDLAGERPEEVRRLEALLAERRANADLARKDVERNKTLIGTEIIAQSQFDRLVAVRDAAEASVRVAEEALATGRAGTRLEDIAIRRADLALREAEVGIAQREVDKTQLVSPFAGSIVRRVAALGDMVGVGEVVYELVDLSQREIEVEIPSARAAQLDAAPPVVVTVDDLPSFRLETRLDSLVAVADSQSRNFRGLVRIAEEQDPERVLKPGMFARLDLGLQPLQDELLVPEDALRETPAGTIVVVARAGEPGPDGRPSLAAEWVPVRVLATEAGMAAVGAPLGAELGLAEGDQVVLSGSDLAFPGATLMPAAARAPLAGQQGEQP